MDKKHEDDSIDEVPSNLNIPKFYRYAVFIVFAVVIAETFPQSINIFIPSDEKNFLTYERIENTATLVLAYYFIIAGWLNYFKVIIVSPFTGTTFGSARFVTDLFIIYLYYYLVKTISNQGLHGQIFVWIFPLIFVTFLVWDILRFYEYRKKVRSDERQGMKGRVTFTGIFFGVMVAQAILYVWPREPLVYGHIVVWNIVFIVISFGIVIVYRKFTSERRRRK